MGSAKIFKQEIKIDFINKSSYSGNINNWFESKITYDTENKTNFYFNVQQTAKYPKIRL